eukprot:TRINITY_DN2852_c0_g1_i2.p1 TRINITY_DN2852_c0_g1~~TRINITY_DN2852_c0_g1_i2.p1  ORF type:complete len:622 (+),score=131.51 TRINITY_DN2852_c0_g1_i2:148-1866(+)
MGGPYEDLSGIKAARIQSVKRAHAVQLFKEGHYEQSLGYFADLETDPMEVMSLFPNLLPYDVRKQYELIRSGMPEHIPEEKAYPSLINFLVRARAALPPLAPNNAGGATPPGPSPADYTEFANVTNVAVFIDTVLLKAYSRLDDSRLASLLRLPNHVHVQEGRKVLMDKQRHHELVLLYRAKGMHREALELLAKLGTNPANGPLGGPTETIAYLKVLGRPQMQLIAEFSRWVLSSYPDDALAIFKEERVPDMRLPSDTVLQHLKQNAHQLVIPFLEHIIHNPSIQERGAEFHDELIFQYLDTVQALQKDRVDSQKKAFIPAGSEPGLLGVTRGKLLSFLEQSNFYSPGRILSKFIHSFQEETLYEERAILLSRIGKHDQALNIYAHKLHNYDMAEEYCGRHYNPDNEESRDVYLQLLNVYLHPPAGIAPMIQPAMTLLSKHHQRIDTPRALSLLPSALPIAQLQPFFEAVLRDTTRTKRNNQVVKNLLKSEKQQIHEQLIRARSRVIKVTDDRICPVCNKRLGNSVFACHPNGVVVHFMCLQTQQAQQQQAALSGSSGAGAKKGGGMMLGSM